MELYITYTEQRFIKQGDARASIVEVVKVQGDNSLYAEPRLCNNGIATLNEAKKLNRVFEIKEGVVRVLKYRESAGEFKEYWLYKKD